MVGIVASKLVERYSRPAFVIAVDETTGEGRGSARSANGVNLYDALATCSDALVRFGGHAAAAGCKVRGSLEEVQHMVLKKIRRAIRQR